MSHAQPTAAHPPTDHIADRFNQLALDRSLIDPDRPQTLYPQHQSTSDHHDSRSERLLRGHTLVAGSGSQFLNSRSRLTSPKPFSRSFTILTSVSPCIHAAFFPSTHSSASLPRFPWVCAKRSSVYQSRLPSRSPSQLPAITNSNQLPIALTSPQAPTTNTPIPQKNTLTPNYVYAHNMQISADNFNTKIPLKSLTNNHLTRYSLIFARNNCADNVTHPCTPLRVSFLTLRHPAPLRLHSSRACGDRGFFPCPHFL